MAQQGDVARGALAVFVTRDSMIGVSDPLAATDSPRAEGGRKP